MQSKFYLLCTASLAVSVVSGIPQAQAADPAVKCESAKLKESAKYGSCRLKAESKGVKKGLPAKFTKCVSKFTEKFNKAETKAGPGVCPSEADELEINARITQDAADIATLLAGGALPGTLPETGQTLCWDGSGASVPCPGTGHDGDTQAGAVLSYVDNGDGTITDKNTGLMWEKKNNANTSLHYKGNSFAWDENAPLNIWDWVAKLNTRCASDDAMDCSVGGDADCTAVGGICGFAGHRDWRIPNVKELPSIISYGGSGPADIFASPCPTGCNDTTPGVCTCGAGTVWSSTTQQGTNPDRAWSVKANGEVTPGNKTSVGGVRAVRGGL